MNFRSALFLLLLSVAVASCRRTDPRTVIISIPDMKDSQSISNVVRAIVVLDGVDGSTVRVNASNRTVTVTYESLKTALRNIEFAVAEAGYQANDIPANPDSTGRTPAGPR